MAQEVSAYPECVLAGEPVLSELTVGQICDALDDYGAWHAAIVFEESSNQKHIHFLVITIIKKRRKNVPNIPTQTP